MEENRELYDENQELKRMANKFATYNEMA